MAYTPKQIEKAKETIIDKLSIGDSLKAILDGDKSLPSRPIVYEWLNSNHKKFDKDFFNNYVRAREDSADLDAENLEEIAQKTLEGKYDPQSARVAADILKWTAGRKKPKKYGDKQAIEHTVKEVSPFKGLNLDVPKDNSTEQDSKPS
jgi:hypothetical protein